ncbi:farnesyl-diphosphate farnesyltransferase [Patellaria atrata CBS 101060]|uniref:Squalene synthase n=1 Tax=Patellaria atrata CBS 101060 TaxID=1346257 RepID=A0A9P4VR29_9PEZI|nr:farnesyl-diphosphate farnesyltransferase [Patellaria atrata CBS 101060]
MPKVTDVLYYLVHVQELRSIIQWKVWHNPVHERDESTESKTLRRCFYFLDQTSRSFSAVIKELNPELLVPICLFYLILRGLDTIEDDMTIKLGEKEPLLREFDNILEKDGWTYNGNGPDETDRQLLVEFDCVITEFVKIKPAYRAIIKDITKKMGDGMADFASNAEYNANGVNKISDYELYCHYVAGLVGEGLTKLFVEAQLANPALLQRPHLHESMGQLLQNVNIIRDVKEDFDDGRRFYPKEVWSKYADSFEDLFKPGNEEAALNCSSEMILIALRRADECLFYLAGLRDQSVFNFCAIPQSMAIATLDLCFRNPDMWKRNVKLTKGHACQLMLDSTQNLQLVCDVFRKHTRSIHQKNTPKDPNFIQISIACGKIEQFIETIFPSQRPDPTLSVKDGRVLSPEEEAKAKKEAQEAKWDIIYMGAAVFGILFFISLFMIFIAYLAGARFDVIYNQLRSGNLARPSAGEAQPILNNYEHQEL